MINTKTLSDLVKYRYMIYTLKNSGKPHVSANKARGVESNNGSIWVNGALGPLAPAYPTVHVKYMGGLITYDTGTGRSPR